MLPDLLAVGRTVWTAEPTANVGVWLSNALCVASGAGGTEPSQEVEALNGESNAVARELASRFPEDPGVLWHAAEACIGDRGATPECLGLLVRCLDRAPHDSLWGMPRPLLNFA